MKNCELYQDVFAFFILSSGTILVVEKNWTKSKMREWERDGKKEKNAVITLAEWSRWIAIRMDVVHAIIVINERGKNLSTRQRQMRLNTRYTDSLVKPCPTWSRCQSPAFVTSSMLAKVNGRARADSPPCGHCLRMVHRHLPLLLCVTWFPARCAARSDTARPLHTRHHLHSPRNVPLLTLE